LEYLNVIPLPTDKLRYAREFHVTSNFHKNLTQRCPHEDDLSSPSDSDNEEEPTRPTEPRDFGRLASSLMPLLERLKDQALMSFR